jgi:hypothetical protein
LTRARAFPRSGESGIAQAVDINGVLQLRGGGTGMASRRTSRKCGEGLHHGPVRLERFSTSARTNLWTVYMNRLNATGPHCKALHSCCHGDFLRPTWQLPGQILAQTNLCEKPPQWLVRILDLLYSVRVLVASSPTVSTSTLRSPLPGRSGL